MNKDVKAFLKVQRAKSQYRPICERVKDYNDVAVLRTKEKTITQSSRCMDCGTPFCHWACPVGNYIPEWNDYLTSGQWRKAYQLLSASNNLPEITGRVCPGLCEYACVLGVSNDPITIRENELGIIEYAFESDIVKPRVLEVRTFKKVAVVGSGPAGLSCADQLNKCGHSVTVFERDDRIGGILRYGIADFKLEKKIIDRRVSIYKKEGILFKTNTKIDSNYSIQKLRNEFDAICFACGARKPRDLKVPGRELDGIHFAMDYLTQSNRFVAGDTISDDELIDAKGKRVVVIGGGDTGSDCVGIANRQGAASVVQIEVMPKPSENRGNDCPWPNYPMLLKTTSSHQEGVMRMWSVSSEEFVGQGNRVKKIICCEVEFASGDKGKMRMKKVDDTQFQIEADLVILAIGFLGPEKNNLTNSLQLDSRGNVATNDNFETSEKGIFCCGDMRRGQSLVVWAISEGRLAAEAINKYLH
ncbi:MAG: glutamate synthase subunit beta [Candidatus Omnitrophica bacterium]|nr:glutamate synthase subunit beta [Candidatus Omnitrophota bacterium]